MITNTNPRILGAGLACLDYIVVSPQVPWGDTAIVTEFDMQGGGLVGTALVACARLGAKGTLLTLLGQDNAADLVLKEIEEEGIDTSRVTHIAGGQTAFSFVHVDNTSGERTIFHRPGSKHAEPPKIPDIKDYAVVLVDDMFLTLALATAKAAKRAGVPVVADLGPSEGCGALLHFVDVLIAPRHFVQELGYLGKPEAALSEIHKLGPTTAVITLGSEGWLYSGPSGKGRGKAFKVDVVDTTGAGDAFHGGFAFALAQGWDTAQCCEFAAAVAAIKCTSFGGRSGLPSLEQVEAFLKERRA